MQIILKEERFSYAVDYGHYDKIEGGWLDEYNPSAKEMIEDFLHLLTCIMSEDSVWDGFSQVVPEGRNKKGAD